MRDTTQNSYERHIDQTIQNTWEFVKIVLHVYILKEHLETIERFNILARIIIVHSLIAKVDKKILIRERDDRVRD